ncbi:NAD(P)/FAD-dependent oxidoreductase [Prosthecomicrobium sp. N25]|uniref:NAD(P)/FAD-dependent oxidoreductase n=1 Tax=Prosthecomicrobium sp. N25 TaxID=3129254 RepID=UPI00307743EE
MIPVAVIGAGMAGVTAARRLAQTGFAPVLFDKSNGISGRMATRRLADLQFDHGAQYFTARGPRFRAVLDRWCAAGLAAEWFDDRFVGLPGMNAVLRAEAAGLPLVPHCFVSGLRKDDHGWTVVVRDGDVTAPHNGRYGAVLLALPAPQAAPLAAAAGLRVDALHQAVYAPCWTLLLAYAEPIGLPDRMRFDEGPIVWIARNGSKPGRPADTETIVVQASPAWSRRHLELSPDRVASLLMEAFLRATGCGHDPLFVQAHRWRYARVEQAAGVPCLWDPDARVGCCGDWCLGPRIECAFDSGEAAAEAVIATFAA